MYFHLPSVNGQTTQDFAVRAALFAACGALIASRFTDLTMTQGALYGALNSAAVQFGHSIVATDKTAKEVLLVSLGSLAASTLLGRVFQLSLGTGIALALCNAFGEAVKIILVPYLYNTSLTSQVPSKEDDVKDLTDADVRQLHENYAETKEKMTPETLRILHGRFYDLDLPLPEGKTFADWRKENFPIVKLPLPQNEEDVQKLKKNQYGYLGFSLLQYGGVLKLAFPVQLALLKKMKTIDFLFNIHPRTASEVEAITDGTDVRWLRNRYEIDRLWLARPKPVQYALNCLFIKHNLTPLDTQKKMLAEIERIEKLDRPSFMEEYNHYERNLDQFQRLDLDVKNAFNKRIAEFHLSSLN